MVKMFVVFLTVVLMLSGCYIDKNDHKRGASGNFQLMQGEDGKIYRLNQATGEVVLIRGDRMIPVTASGGEAVEGDAVPGSMKKSIDFGERQMPGKELRSKFKTGWVDGKFYYVFTVYPYSSLEQLFEQRLAHYCRFVLRIKDADGFVIYEMPVRLTDMKEVYDARGMITSLYSSASADISESDYQDIKDYDVIWRLKSDLVADERIPVQEADTPSVPEEEKTAE